MGMLRAVVAGVVGGLVLAGCGGGSGGGNGAEGAVGPTAVEVDRDEDRAAEAVIGADGGELAVTAEDGTAFELTVPAGALVADTTIRAVPVTLDGLGAREHTVMFEPSGLRFYDWARLTVEPAEDVPVEEQLLFGVTDDGRTVSAAFLDVESETPTILLDHFSGYGLARTTDSQRAALLQSSAADAATRISNRMAEALGQLRGDALLGVESDRNIGDLFLSSAEEYETEVLQPLLEAAGASCAATQNALQHVLGYERQRELLGLGGTPTKVDGKAILVDALSTDDGPCEKEAIEACRSAKDPGILLTFWLGRERQRQLLGVTDGGPALGDLEKRARRICLPQPAFEISGTVESQPSGITLAGNTCSLTAPFRVQTNGDIIGTIRFRPRDETGGSWSYRGVVGNAPELSVDGSGSYTVDLAEDDRSGTIDFDFRLTVRIPVVGDQTNGAPASLGLTAIEPCS